MDVVELLKSLRLKFKTLNPFVICDNLGIEIKYVDFLINPRGQYNTILDEKIILLSNSIKDSNERFFVCSHELAHAIYHSDIASYYSLNNISKSKSENEANFFATNLLIELYIEENGNHPENIAQLTSSYGLPEDCYQFLE